MKIKVVGWTQYDLHEFDEGDSGWAVRMAVVDDIRKNGYLFSGYAHQEYSNCAPVFNDGKMRRFSQRGFADMIARRHRLYGIFFVYVRTKRRAVPLSSKRSV